MSRDWHDHAAGRPVRRWDGGNSGLERCWGSPTFLVECLREELSFRGSPWPGWWLALRLSTELGKGWLWSFPSLMGLEVPVRREWSGLDSVPTRFSGGPAGLRAEKAGWIKVKCLKDQLNVKAFSSQLSCQKHLLRFKEKNVIPRKMSNSSAVTCQPLRLIICLHKSKPIKC